jgi:uncharacterized surface protein with fasciclin (FAS1) repeats
MIAMKNKNILKPIAVMTLSAFVMYGCAGSRETTDATAMADATYSETERMAGIASDAEGEIWDVLVVEETAVVPVGTIAATALLMENPVEIDDMFEDIEETEQFTALELARKTPNLSTFVTLIEQAGLEDDLERLDQMTFFAPTNEAFAKLPKDKLSKLLLTENRPLLSAMMQAHILPSEVVSGQLQSNVRIRMTDQSYLPVGTDHAGTITTVGNAQLIKSDVRASNGRIHVLDSVILPSAVVAL